MSTSKKFRPNWTGAHHSASYPLRSGNHRLERIATYKQYKHRDLSSLKMRRVYATPNSRHLKNENQVDKGSEAVGSSARVSFSAPPHCSTSQVSQGTCGDPVLYYIVEWDTSDSFNSAALSSLVVDGEDLLLQEQKVTTMASSGMSGTFQLSFNGETTPVINAAASAEDLRSALETLNGVTTAEVSRDLAVAAVGGDGGGAELDLTFGSQDVQCTSGPVTVADPSCDVNFSACQLVRLEGVWYRVEASFEADNSGQVSRGVFRDEVLFGYSSRLMFVPCRLG